MNRSAIIGRLVKSPTVMTWASTASRTLSLFVVLPLLLTRLSTPEIAVWYVFLSLIGLQQLADFGFTPTFARAFAFALAEEGESSRGTGTSQAIAPMKASRVERTWWTMHSVYKRLTVASGIVFAFLGTLVLIRPASQLPQQSHAWGAWVIICLTFIFTMRFGAYSAYLQGVDEIARLRKWEALVSTAASLCSVLVMLAGGGLLSLVITNQVFSVASALKNRSLARGVRRGLAATFRSTAVDLELRSSIAENAVKSGIGVLMSRGILLSSGLIVAQIANPAGTAAYLLASRIMQVVADFANAPFYSRLPKMARLWAQNQRSELVDSARVGMRASFWAFVLATLAIAVAAPVLFGAIGSNAPWVPAPLWAVMTASQFVERYGAMYLQLYSVTDHIIWHIANGVTGVIYLAVGLIAVPHLQLYAFPVAMLIGYSAFYSWYAPMHAYKVLPMRFWQFSSRTALVPLVVGAIAHLAIALSSLGVRA